MRPFIVITLPTLPPTDISFINTFSFDLGWGYRFYQFLVIAFFIFSLLLYTGMTIQCCHSEHDLISHLTECHPTISRSQPVCLCLQGCNNFLVNRLQENKKRQLNWPAWSGIGTWHLISRKMVNINCSLQIIWRKTNQTISGISSEC